jgi:hypothetical protein
MRRRCVAPPILKLWPGISGIPAATQNLLHLLRKRSFVNGDQLPPTEELNKKNGILGGPEKLRDKCRLRARSRQRGSPGRAVIEMLVPLFPVVLDHGMKRVAYSVPCELLEEPKKPKDSLEF